MITRIMADRKIEIIDCDPAPVVEPDPCSHLEGPDFKVIPGCPAFK